MLALTLSNHLYGWGAGGFGESGYGEMVDSELPRRVEVDFNYKD